MDSVFIPELEMSWRYVPILLLMMTTLKRSISCLLFHLCGRLHEGQMKGWRLVLFICGVCSLVSCSDGLYSGGLVFWLSTGAAAVDAGQHDQEEKCGNKENEHKEGSQLQSTGLWETLQFGPHLLKNIQHLLFHLHADSQMQVPHGDMKKMPQVLLAGRQIGLYCACTVTPLQ